MQQYNGCSLCEIKIARYRPDAYIISYIYIISYHIYIYKNECVESFALQHTRRTRVHNDFLINTITGDASFTTIKLRDATDNVYESSCASSGSSLSMGGPGEWTMKCNLPNIFVCIALLYCAGPIYNKYSVWALSKFALGQSRVDRHVRPSAALLYFMRYMEMDFLLLLELGERSAFSLHPLLRQGRGRGSKNSLGTNLNTKRFIKHLRCEQLVWVTSILQYNTYDNISLC